MIVRMKCTRSQKTRGEAQIRKITGSKESTGRSLNKDVYKIYRKKEEKPNKGSVKDHQKKPK